jgi:glutathionyl-hydroquinone reductase
MEAAVSAVVAVIAGLAAVTNRLHNRINLVHSRITDLDRRVDGVELRIATNYVDKGEFKAGLQRMEDHMVRIENKLDQIVMRNG